MACGNMSHTRRAPYWVASLLFCQGDAMSQIKNVEKQPEMASLLLGAGFAMASLIILPAVAQRVGLGSSLTIVLRGALMRAANRL